MSRARPAAALPCAVLLAAALAACTSQAPPGAPKADTRKSGFEYMGASTQAMQRDDNANPGMLWVGEGAQLWARAEGRQAKACLACHGQAQQSMKGVAAGYPAWDALSGKPLNLSMRINLCRERHQQAPALRPESRELLSLEAFVAHQSRGLPLRAPPDERLAPARARGAQLYAQPLGQLDLSCAHCHDQRAGLKLAASLIPEAHPTGYPLYRLEWQALGSLQRRLRNCMTGVRAEPYAYNAPEMVELELHLVQRALGMPLEAPGVRP